MNSNDIKKNKRYNDAKYTAMTCCEPNCQARVYRYDDGRCIYAHKFAGHNHTSTSEDIVDLHEFKQNLKEECVKLDLVGGKLPSVKDVYMKLSDE